MFVGIGASRVRDMFDKARTNAPCILFIDEFDGLGKQRSFSSMGNDGEANAHTCSISMQQRSGCAVHEIVRWSGIVHIEVLHSSLSWLPSML